MDSLVTHLIMFWLGGAIDTLFMILIGQSWKRVGVYGCVFMTIYWLPQAIEAAVSKFSEKG